MKNNVTKIICYCNEANAKGQNILLEGFILLPVEIKPLKKNMKGKYPKVYFMNNRKVIKKYEGLISSNKLAELISELNG